MKSRKEYFRDVMSDPGLREQDVETRRQTLAQALESRFGQDATLLASEERLIQGLARTHRAGKRPWTGSKKRPSAAEMPATGGGAAGQVPAQATGGGARGHVPAPPASSTDPVPATVAPAVVEVPDVKEELLECFHTESDVYADGSRNKWPLRTELSVDIWEGNQVKPERVAPMLSALDATLFQYNMRGWYDVQGHITKHQDTFNFYHMATSSGSRGLMVVCKECSQVCKISWHKRDAEDDPRREECRRILRSYMGFGTCSEKRMQRIV